MSPDLRPMTPADVPEVAELEEVLFGRGRWRPSMFLSELRAPRRHYRVAEVGGVLAGYAGIALGESAQVMTIGVHPEHQRRGIGRVLFDDLLRAARAGGAREVVLEVRVDASVPQAMYASFGFTPLGVRKNYYQPEGIDALVMHKRLRRPLGPVGSEVTT